MIRVFIDTNIFISAYFFTGNERTIVYSRLKNIKYFTSQQVIDEIRAVLGEKFSVDKKDIDDYLSKILLIFALINPDYNINIMVRDEKDTNILKSALAAKCNYLVTGDIDLLTLKKVENLKIVKSRELINELKLNFSNNSKKTD